LVDGKKVGVLAVQGDFEEHLQVLARLGVEGCEVRLAQHLEGLDALIIPGGESTTIGKMVVDFGLLTPLKDFGYKKPIWGTCAGAIFLSKDASRIKAGQPLLGLMDITVERNAFGRQVDSFETKLQVPALKKIAPEEYPYPAVFIRAPLIESVQGDAVALAFLDDGRIVAAQQGHLLATSFHPELTEDDRFHRYFLTFLEY
jgi:5'-phosphate synthase pdxT subunit